MNPVASSTPSNSKPPSRTPLSVLPINHVNPNPLSTQLCSVSLCLIKSNKRDYTTVPVHDMRAWDTLKQLESFIKSIFTYGLGDLFLVGYVARNTHLELGNNEDLRLFMRLIKENSTLLLWDQVKAVHFMNVILYFFLLEIVYCRFQHKIDINLPKPPKLLGYYPGDFPQNLNFQQTSWSP